jgi:hypothetical protein
LLRQVVFHLAISRDRDNKVRAENRIVATLGPVAMNKCTKSQVLAGICSLIAALVSVAAEAAWHYRIFSWTDFQVYRAMGAECHSVWQEFHFRRIGPGADLMRLIEMAEPDNVATLGDFTALNYSLKNDCQGVCSLSFRVFCVTTYRGRLVAAETSTSCGWKTFFDVRTPEQRDLYEQEVDEYLKRSANLIGDGPRVVVPDAEDKALPESIDEAASAKSWPNDIC